MDVELSNTDRSLLQTLISVVTELQKEVTALRQERTGELLHTVEEAAAILHLSPRIVTRKIKDGLIAASKVGRQTWITTQELNRYRQSKSSSHTVDSNEVERLFQAYKNNSKPKKQRKAA